MFLFVNKFFSIKFVGTIDYAYKRHFILICMNISNEWGTIAHGILIR